MAAMPDETYEYDVLCVGCGAVLVPKGEDARPYDPLPRISVSDDEGTSSQNLCQKCAKLFDAILWDMHKARYAKSFPRNRAVVTVLGSTRFREDIRQWAWNETRIGKVVLFAPFAKEEVPGLEQHRDLLEEIHFQKIRMADEVFVFNKGGYVGDSTKKEIAYAEHIGKKVRYLEGDRK